MPGDVTLGGPVWLFAQVLILGTLGLSLFVLVDSLMPRRRAKLGGRLREPLWVYSAVIAAYLSLLMAVQLVPGLQAAAAVVAVATPFALALCIVYLLRAVFPRASESSGSESGHNLAGPNDS